MLTQKMTLKSREHTIALSIFKKKKKGININQVFIEKKILCYTENFSKK